MRDIVRANIIFPPTGIASKICGIALLAIFHYQIPAITIDINRTEQESIVRNVSTVRYSGVGNVGGCSATPVSPHLIVTAAHCVPPNANRKYFKIAYEDKPSVFIWGNVFTYPGYNRNVDPWNQAGVPDLAVIVLDSPLPPYVKTYKLCTFLGTDPSGVVVELVGYGNTGSGITGQIEGTYSSSTKRYAQNEIDRIQRNGNYFDFDFDGGVSLPSRRLPYGPDSTYLSRNNRLGSRGLGPIEGASAQGDSGGPAFYNPATSLKVLTERLSASGDPVPSFKLVPDELYLIGVTSYGTTYSATAKFSAFGTTASYTLVPKYVPWIQSFDTSISPQLFSERVTVSEPDHTELVAFAHFSGPPEEAVPNVDVLPDPMFLTEGSDLSSDNDGDGLSLGYEVMVGTNPNAVDLQSPINSIEKESADSFKYVFQMSRNYVHNRNVNLSEVIEVSADLTVWARPRYEHTHFENKHVIIVTVTLRSSADVMFVRLNPKVN